MWTVSDWLLSRLDSSSVIVFLLVFLVGYYWLTTPSNLPPGPRPLPVVGNMLAVRAALPNLLEQMHKWRKQHGDIFTLRLGNKLMVVISSYKLLHETFVKKSYVFSGRPKNLHTVNQVIRRLGTGVLFNDGPQWKKLRRVTLMAMRDFGLGKKSLEQRVQKEARAVMEVMDKNRGVAMTMKPLLAKFSANVICSVIFGDRMDYDDANFVELTNLVNRAASQPFVFAPVNFVSVMRFLPFSKRVVNGLVGAFTAVDEFLENVLKEHEETYNPDEVRDFVDIYIKTRSESEDTHLYTAKNLRRVILDLFLAGTETSSTTLDWLILYMVAFPEVQTRCQKDIDKVLGQDRLVTMEDRKDLPYIEAVVTEIMRLVPVVPLGFPHVIVKEAELAGYTLPADTMVLSNINEIHHDPAVWPDPHLFKPDRFLDKGGHFCPPKENYLPFSIGPRVCLGEVLARMEVFILFTTLLQYFTFTMGQGQKPDICLGQMGITQMPKCQAVFATRRC